MYDTITDNTSRFVADIMQIGNAQLMARLSDLVSIPLAEIPAPVRLTVISALRERHTTMPAGREISLLLQSSLERALIQGRLYLMRMPGAAEGLRVAVAQYAGELETRRELVHLHLGTMEADAVSALGAIEWCERLVTKFTPQEIARADLAEYARRMDAIHDRLTRFDPAVGDVLRCTIALLSLAQNVSQNALERVRQSLPDFAIMVPEPATYQMARAATAR